MINNCAVLSAGMLGGRSDESTVDRSTVERLIKLISRAKAFSLPQLGRKTLELWRGAWAQSLIYARIFLFTQQRAGICHANYFSVKFRLNNDDTIYHPAHVKQTNGNGPRWGWKRSITSRELENCRRTNDWIKFNVLEDGLKIDTVECRW